MSQQVCSDLIISVQKPTGMVFASGTLNKCIQRTRMCNYNRIWVTLSRLCIGVQSRIPLA